MLVPGIFSFSLFFLKAFPLSVNKTRDCVIKGEVQWLEIEGKESIVSFQEFLRYAEA